MIIKAPAVLLNDQYVSEIGHQLRRRREQSGESVAEVADQLLLSKDQIAGLEHFSLDKFYGQRHFAQALMKYAEFLQNPIDPDQITLHGDLTVGIVPIEPQSTDEEATLPTQSSSANRYWYGLASIAIVGIALLTQYGGKAARPSNEATPSTPSKTMTEAASASEPSTPAMDSQPLATIAPVLNSPSKNDTPIVLETHSSCWIQLNHADGKISQKVYPSNSKLEFARGELSGIIIGNLNAATLSVNNEKITLAKYQKPDSNVARILGQDGSKLLGK